jgi:WhiB family transcriptional regulator, redox-sensing transcriptional regulator
MDWRSRSACRDEEPELFFPIGTTGPAVEQTDAAKRICMRCDVREECLEFALATNQDAGIWGGLNEDERRTLRRQRQRRRRIAS